LPGESQCGYLEISGSGIELTKKEMDAQKNAALEAGAKVVDTNTQESGEARRARQDDQQASLHSIVTCAAAAIEQAIKYAAQWLKLDPSKYTFTVEPEFIVQQYDINLAKQLYEGAIAGKNSFQTYWEYIATGKLPAHDFQEELKRVESERDSMPL
ncbi:DUF4055 domain-containing protein, partial [Acinetobacter baumannii]|nr:DUF4055 domain-containing protein [Acinetobacter baumannii]EHU2809690.1 DUF4055 domain-containing protein [Acinetobacter baumannii]